MFIRKTCYQDAYGEFNQWLPRIERSDPMASERGLGKGLGALLGDAALQTQEGGSVTLPIAQVEPGIKQIGRAHV